MYWLLIEMKVKLLLILLLLSLGGCDKMWGMMLGSDEKFSQIMGGRIANKYREEREREREKYRAQFKDKTMIYHGKIEKHWCGGFWYVASIDIKPADELYEMTVKDANKNGTPGEYLVDAESTHSKCIVVTGTMASVKQEEPGASEKKAPESSSVLFDGLVVR